MTRYCPDCQTDDFMISLVPPFERESRHASLRQQFCTLVIAVATDKCFEAPRNFGWARRSR